MALDRTNAVKKLYSEQHRGNFGWDEEFQLPVVEIVDYDGQNLQRGGAAALAYRIQSSGTDTYIAQAAPGTAAATAKWQAYKVDEDGNLTFADGDASYDNVASDLTALTYS